ncbi:hypothetical protein B0H14DRAFT_2625509 [Mycena olivaceomarginata]|nr:hypothetical protein B0H14DRAFT_2625509 [Mycena olivaceomarginata]
MAARCGVEAPLLDPAPTALDAILPTTLTIVGGVASVVEVRLKLALNCDERGKFTRKVSHLSEYIGSNFNIGFEDRCPVRKDRHKVQFVTGAEYGDRRSVAGSLRITQKIEISAYTVAHAVVFARAAIVES